MSRQVNRKRAEEFMNLATRQTLEKLAAAIGHLGLQPADIVRLKAFLEPMSEVGAVRKEIEEFFGGSAPPAVFVEWIAKTVTMDMIAVTKVEK
jgi:enamine deaminase RidA (YjgF/YER057c/UK114 family)